MTASNLFIQIIQAGGGNPVTFRSRKNAANDNMVISAISSQTGLLQDTTSWPIRLEVELCYGHSVAVPMFPKS